MASSHRLRPRRRYDDDCPDETIGARDATTLQPRSERHTHRLFADTNLRAGGDLRRQPGHPPQALYRLPPAAALKTYGHQRAASAGRYAATLSRPLQSSITWLRDQA